MKCPRTGSPLKEALIDDVKVDISELCGGVWFDNYELAKFDEVHESAGEQLIELMATYKTVEVDLSQRLYSPRHPETIMMRRYFSTKRQIEIDECPMSGGIWLDAGELTQIRNLYPTEEARKQAGKAFVEEIFQGAALAEDVQKSAQSLQKAQRIAGLFRWICPSYYIPGDQDWGAF